MATEDGKPAPHSEIDEEKAIVSEDNGAAKKTVPHAVAKPPYSAFGPGQKRLVLGIVTAAGFFGPLAGGIYLPALPTLQRAFNTSATVINATVSVFMGVLAVAVRFRLFMLIFITKPVVERYDLSFPEIRMSQG